MTKINLKKLNLPSKPGCYLYKDKNSSIIYIGKAKNIRKRVASYFRNRDLDEKTKQLVSEIFDIDYIITDNELEAMLLESKLIRKNKPKYNIDLKDNIRYAYLRVTGEKFPRIVSTRDIDEKGIYFGPYGDSNSRETALYYATVLFKIRTCGAKLPKKVCLQYYIKRCDAPCINNISEKNYNKNVRNAIDFLKGKAGVLKRRLKQEMKKYSNNLEYEKAKVIRDQLKGLERIKELIKQKISLIKAYNEDFINYLTIGDRVYIHLFTVDKGTVSGKKEFVFAKQKEILEEFIKLYYSDNDIPDEIILPHQIIDQKLIEEFLTKLHRKKTGIIVPQTGNKKKLLNLIKENIEQSIKRQNPALVELKEILNLANIPNIIECFDISTILGKNTTGSMVQFSGGQPDKNNYRRFKIKTIFQQDDVAAMAEIVRRRYYRQIIENNELPDLIVIDGGRGQLNAAFNTLKSLGLNIPIIGLAKKLEEIYTIDNPKPLRLSHKRESLKMLQKIRDEAHRFAIKYHRLLRNKKLVE